MDKSLKTKYSQLNIDKNSMRNVQNGYRDSLSDEDENELDTTFTNRMHRDTKAADTDEAEVIEIDSEDSRDGYRNNNNEESSPDRQRAYEQNNNNNDSDHESTSSDIVVVRDDYQNFFEEIEQLSKINSTGKVCKKKSA